MGGFRWLIRKSNYYYYIIKILKIEIVLKLVQVFFCKSYLAIAG